jgi:ATP-dependent phosphoenolpyruvate carboxykinase
MDPIREKEIWWGDVNKPIEASSFQILEDTAINYFNTRSRVSKLRGVVVRVGRLCWLGERFPN